MEWLIGCVVRLVLEEDDERALVVTSILNGSSADVSGAVIIVQGRYFLSTNTYQFLELKSHLLFGTLSTCHGIMVWHMILFFQTIKISSLMNYRLRGVGGRSAHRRRRLIRGRLVLRLLHCASHQPRLESERWLMLSANLSSESFNFVVVFHL